MSSSESVKQALIKQILLESNTANARQLIEVSLALLSVTLSWGNTAS